MPSLHGTQHPRAKLTIQDVTAIRTSYRPGVITMQKLADRHGITSQGISDIIRGRTWKHVAVPTRKAGE